MREHPLIPKKSKPHIVKQKGAWVVLTCGRQAVWGSWLRMAVLYTQKENRALGIYQGPVKE